MVGSVFLLFVTIMAWGLLIQAESWDAGQLVGLGFAGVVAVVTSLASALPYILGSLAARTAPRPWWIVWACVAVALASVAFRGYVYGTAGGGQAFINIILNAVPYSAVVLAGWAAGLWRSILQAGDLGKDRTPSVPLAAVVTAAALLGVGGSVSGWLLRDSPLWMPIGGSMALASFGLGFWATRWARQR